MAPRHQTTDQGHQSRPVSYHHGTAPRQNHMSYGMLLNSVSPTLPTQKQLCNRLRWRGNVWAVLWAGLALVLSVAQTTFAQTPSPNALYHDAAAASERGDSLRAIALYKQLIELQPDSAEARTNLGVVLAQT